MRIVAFKERLKAPSRLTPLDGDRVLNFRAAARSAEYDPAFADMVFASVLSLVQSGPAGLEAAGHLALVAPQEAWRSLDDLHLAAPLSPNTILCTGSNYHDHNREKAGAPTSGKELEFFIKTADCVIGPDDPIVLDPAITRKLDCETELAIVIGTEGRRIPVDKALDHVFGYTVVNYVTARDRQVRQTKGGDVWYDLGRGKLFDTSAPMGPCILTADAVPNPQALNLSTTINGELRQSGSTSDMIWSCAEVVHFFSNQITLRPGMVIITGTPAGTAWSTDVELGGRNEARPGLVAATRYCLPGDRVECRIEQIGTLSNTVAALDG